jgi:sigma-54-specific transcriptional regulator
MTERARPTLLILPNARGEALSIRAKALAFNDPKSQQVLALAERIAASDATALIVGETGTGKELFARHIHQVSGRTGQFVALNCASLGDALVEAELFGHETGAFTGASNARAGWFEAADGGTLFLDEIGDMPLAQQAKLLRVLQEKQVVRIGSRRPIPVDVRLVAATNVDLGRAVQAGHFRSDLYYRVNVAPLRLPPLRERRDDIIPLARHFMEVYRRKLGGHRIVLSARAEQALYQYDWPGNIRELENVIHFSMIVCPHAVLQASDLSLPPSNPGKAADRLQVLKASIQNILESEYGAIDEVVHKSMITTAFEFAGGNQVRAASLLGISRNVMRTQLKRFGLLESR